MVSDSPSPTQPCPQGSSKCRKQCEPDYYLDSAGRCTPCVSCSQDDLVEKTPCTWNSSRVCECRPGMFCAMSVTNSCARCVPYPICAAEMVTKPQAPPRYPEMEAAGSHSLSMGPGFPGRLPTQGRDPLRTRHTQQQKKPSLSLTGIFSTLKNLRIWRGHTILLSTRKRKAIENSTEKKKLTRNTQSKYEDKISPDIPASLALVLSYYLPSADVAERDTTFEPPTPVTPDCILTPENDKTPASTSPTLSSLVDSQDSKTLPIPTSAPIALSSTGKPILDTGPVLFWVGLVIAVVVSASAFLLCHRRACRTRIRQSKWLCSWGLGEDRLLSASLAWVPALPVPAV
ncbi:hypothetical protein P7K49_015464 [Saguinus oedipus]|uniref:TNFR-Cys domain-containing protein n=1 Tax=Saguinus oedipus TaxID=9490 RepID=A0ABQ9V9C2_SAGOE|nr:hypothetical protein P7K49_015464 [Saguinus oedipus]